MDYTEIEIEGMKEILRDKEKEIKKLKSDLSLVIKERDDNIKQNKKLSEKNGQLKSDLAFKNTMLDNVKAEYESSLNVNKKLNEKVRFLEECLDRKEKLNEKYRKEIEKSYVYDAKQVRDIC